MNLDKLQIKKLDTRYDMDTFEPIGGIMIEYPIELLQDYKTLNGSDKAKEHILLKISKELFGE